MCCCLISKFIDILKWRHPSLHTLSIHTMYRLRIVPTQGTVEVCETSQYPQPTRSAARSRCVTKQHALSISRSSLVRTQITSNDVNSHLIYTQAASTDVRPRLRWSPSITTSTRQPRVMYATFCLLRSHDLILPSNIIYVFSYEDWHTSTFVSKKLLMLNIRNITGFAY